LALHQQAADQLGGDQLGGAGEEGLGEGLKVLGRCGGYGSGLRLLDDMFNKKKAKENIDAIESE